jgi:hypothetical protein
MFAEDYDFQKLLPVGPVQINDMKEEYRAKFDIAVNELKHFVLKRSGDKADEIESLKSCLSSVKAESDQKSILKLQEFQHQKKEVLIYESIDHLGIEIGTNFS